MSITNEHLPPSSFPSELAYRSLLAKCGRVPKATTTEAVLDDDQRALRALHGEREAWNSSPVAAQHMGLPRGDQAGQSGSSPPTAPEKLAAIQRILDRVRRGDHWLVLPGKDPSHRRSKLTDALLLNSHFSSEGAPVGACPMAQGSDTTRLALLDVDSHKGEVAWPQMQDAARKLTTAAASHGIKLVPFRSGGGKGMHLYAIWELPQDARSVRAAMCDVVRACGYKPGAHAEGLAGGYVELFPKQDSVPADGWGNMFVLPLAAKSVALDPTTLDEIDCRRIEWFDSEQVPVLAPVERPVAVVNETAEIAKVRDALFLIDPNKLGYGGDGGATGWLEILFAAHSATDGSADGLALMIEWSSRWSGYDAAASRAETEKQWSYAKRKDGGITVQRLFDVAAQNGWVDPSRLEGLENLDVTDAKRLLGRFILGDTLTASDVAVAVEHPGVLGHLEALSPAAADEARTLVERARASEKDAALATAERAREVSVQALAEAGAETAFPAPFRGPMAAAVEVGLRAAHKPQPALTTLAALIGMAACLPGHYRLPGGGRMNLYGLGALETGGGKDHPRRVATAIAINSNATVIGGPASGQALEDALVADTPMLVEVDEVAHVLSAMAGTKAPAYIVELARRLLTLFSASAGQYHCRARAVAKASNAGSTPRSLRNPCVSFLGFATPTKLGEALTVGNIEDGLLGRMLFAFGDGEVRQRRVTDEFVLPVEFERYRACFDQSVAMINPQTGYTVTVRYGDGADAMHEALIDEFNGGGETSPFSKALRQRAVEKILRIAGVLACFDDPLTPVMTVEHLEWAAKLVRASNDALEKFVADRMHGSEVQADAARVLSVIDRIVAGKVQMQRASWDAAASAGLAHRSALLKASKLDKRKFDEAVAYLLAVGDVEAATVTTGERAVSGLRRTTE